MSEGVKVDSGCCDERREEGPVEDVHGVDFDEDACVGDVVSTCGSSSDAEAEGRTA